jgi:hypothetical protein
MSSLGSDHKMSKHGSSSKESSGRWIPEISESFEKLGPIPPCKERLRLFTIAPIGIHANVAAKTSAALLFG